MSNLKQTESNKVMPALQPHSLLDCIKITPTTILYSNTSAKQKHMSSQNHVANLLSWPSQYLNLREFVENYHHLDSRRVSGWFRTARRVSDPGDSRDPRDPGDPTRLSNLLEFETPLEVERFVISNERPLMHFSVPTFKNIGL